MNIYLNYYRLLNPQKNRVYKIRKNKRSTFYPTKRSKVQGRIDEFLVYHLFKSKKAKRNFHSGGEIAENFILLDQTFVIVLHLTLLSMLLKKSPLPLFKRPRPSQMLINGDQLFLKVLWERKYFQSWRHNQTRFIHPVFA
jgi:hypothetical protein